MAEGVRFIRVHGRVVPLRDSKPGESKNGKKPTIKRTSVGLAAVTGVSTTLLARKVFGFSPLAAAGLGLASALSARSMRYTARAKGETNKQAATRVAMGNRAYNLAKKKRNK